MSVDFTHQPKLKVAVIGAGFIGSCHMDALRRVGLCELVAVADADMDKAAQKAKEYGIRAYAGVGALLAQEDIQAVVNATPTHEHLSVNGQVIKSGKHLFCEKPLARNSAESARMLALLADQPQLVHAIDFTYRMYPLMQNLKSRIAAGECGRVLSLGGHYLQDFLLYPSDYSWRCEEEFTGPSRCIAEIGSHWLDLAETLTGDRIAQVLADVAIFYPERYQAGRPIPITTEDYASILFRTAGGAHGAFTVSNSCAGHKNDLAIRIDGTESSFSWHQETPETLYKGERDRASSLQAREPIVSHSTYPHLPAGHPEGFRDALFENLHSFIEYIGQGKSMSTDKPAFATLDDGHRVVCLVEAILKSHRLGSWVSVTGPNDGPAHERPAPT